MVSVKRQTYWQVLESLALAKLGVSAKHICQVAKIPRSTAIGLQCGSQPQVKTKTKINQALENLGMSFCNL